MNSETNSKRIDEEKVCIDSFKFYLKDQFDCNIEVHQEDNDPPDYWISVESQEFAVEITSIVENQSYHASITYLKNDIKKEIIQNKAIQGTYALVFKGTPEIPKRHSKQRASLIQNSIKLMLKLEPLYILDEDTLFKDDKGVIKITKCSDTGSTIGNIGPTEAKWEGQVEVELQELLKVRLDDKIEKLSKANPFKTHREYILLLYDAYGYGNHNNAQKALLSLDNYNFFHSIFWAESFTDKKNILYPNQPGRLGYFIFSKNPNW